MIVKRGLALVWAGLLAAASLMGTPSPAMAANSGTVMCADQSTVVGVWVEVSGGRSGWATRSGSGYSQRWSYNTQAKSYSLHVGCGGTPQKWAYSTKTTFTTTKANATCFPGGSYGLGTVFVYNKCYWT